MDKNLCYFDIPRSSPIDKKGVHTVKIKTTGAERLHFTIALTEEVKQTKKWIHLLLTSSIIDI